jgi:hypothetical protein
MPRTSTQSSRACAGRQHAVPSARGRRGRGGRLRVDARPELRREPDWDRFAWALLQYVRVQRAAKQGQKRKGAAR